MSQALMLGLEPTGQVLPVHLLREIPAGGIHGLDGRFSFEVG